MITVALMSSLSLVASNAVPKGLGRAARHTLFERGVLVFALSNATLSWVFVEIVNIFLLWMIRDTAARSAESARSLGFLIVIQVARSAFQS
jgi:hypothetical protein